MSAAVDGGAVQFLPLYGLLATPMPYIEQTTAELTHLGNFHPREYLKIALNISQTLRASIPPRATIYHQKLC